jgi:flagellar hook protein FlgE
MGLTSAMYSGLSGLNANQTRIETIGNNIANVNTTAFQGSRTLFQTQFSETLSAGTAPNTTSGGTNPVQIGHGTMVGTTQRLTGGGSVETTGLSSDMAVEGAGYFLVHNAAGQDLYTRDGSFVLNDQNVMVSADGNYLQGYGADATGTITTGQLQNLTIPLGQASIARATESVTLGGDLSAADAVATKGSIQASQALVDGGAAAATAATALTDLRSAAAPGTILFAAGDTITVSGVSRGGRTIPSAQFVVGTTGSTLGDLANWLQSDAGIQTGGTLTDAAGVTIENGQLTIRSNAGEPNALDLTTNDLTSSNAGTALPLQFSRTQTAVGSGLSTGFTVYDSLGNPVQVNATFTLESTPSTGPVWRYLLEAPASGSTPRTLATGTVTFDTNGNFVTATGNQISIDRSNTGAASPLAVTLDFSSVNGRSTRASDVVMNTQDGYPTGTMTGYSIGDDGIITGTYSNGVTQQLGQVVLATFPNDIGLIAEGDNLFRIGPNSGSPAIVVPGANGAGTIHSGALELSNVDLSSEFIGLITSSTGFQANSRVISTTNQMLDQLLLVLR